MIPVVCMAMIGPVLFLHCADAFRPSFHHPIPSESLSLAVIKKGRCHETHGVKLSRTYSDVPFPIMPKDYVWSMLSYAFSEYKFHMRNIPYQMGLRHLHSPEHISKVHLWSMQFFKLKNTTEPMVYGRYTLVECDIEMGGESQSVLVFTNKPNESQIICRRKDNLPYLHLLLLLSPSESCKGGGRGHHLTIQATYLETPLKFCMILSGLLQCIHLIEDSLFWAYDFKEDPNLAKYRRMVLDTKKDVSS